MLLATIEVVFRCQAYIRIHLPHESCITSLISSLIEIQSNLDCPDLEYPDFPLWSQFVMNISHIQDSYEKMYFFQTVH